jgi:hypothetical protein
MRAIRLSFRSLRFEVAPEREHLYGRIKGLLEKAEEIANGHSGESVKVRLKAMDVYPAQQMNRSKLSGNVYLYQTFNALGGI